MVNFLSYISVMLLVTNNIWQAQDLGGSNEELFLDIWASEWDS
jgi:hypothetical protein